MRSKALRRAAPLCPQLTCSSERKHGANFLLQCEAPRFPPPHLDPVRDEVVHVGVLVPHVLLHAQRGAPLLVQPAPHLVEKPQGLLDGAVPPGAFLVLLAALLDLVRSLVQGSGFRVSGHRQREVAHK